MNVAELLFLVAIIVAVCIFVIPLASLPQRSMRIDNEAVLSLNDGWAQVTEGKDEPVTLPYTTPVGDSGEIVFYRSLPSSITWDSMLCVETYSENVRAYIDGEVVYEYDITGGTPFSKSLGYTSNLIPVPREAAGKTVALAVESEDPDGISIVYNTFLGTKSAIVLQLIRRNVWVLASGLLLLAMGIGLVAASFFTNNRKMFAFLGIFAAISAIWMITDTQLLQLFFDNQAAAYLASFSTFMLLPIPFLLFLKEAGNQKRNRLLDLFCILYTAQYFINMILSITGTAPLSTTIIVTHVLIVATVVVSVIVFTKDAVTDHNKDAWFIAAGFLVLGVFALLDIFRFYTPSADNNSTFFRIGLIIFICMFSVGAFMKNRSIAEANSELVQNSKMMDFYISTLERQNEMAAQTAKNMVIFRHDLRHITNMISACLNNGDTAGAAELLSAIDKNVGTAWAGRPVEPFTGHKMMDATIAYYMNYARQSGISTTMKVGQIHRLQADKMELAVVLANALENAVEACRKLPEGQERVVKLYGSQHGKQYFWEVVNSHKGDVQFSAETGLPVSEEEGHGYGTQSMEIFAKKYNAILRFFVEGDLFHMQLLA